MKTKVQQNMRTFQQRQTNLLVFFPCKVHKKIYKFEIWNFIRVFILINTMNEFILLYTFRF